MDVEFRPFDRSRRKRCVSCNALIDHGADCLEFKRMQYPQNEVQAKIYGDWDVEITLPSYFICETCGEIYLNLWALGYECMNPQNGMQKYLDEYHDLTGWVPGMGPGPSNGNTEAHNDHR